MATKRQKAKKRAASEAATMLANQRMVSMTRKRRKEIALMGGRASAKWLASRTKAEKKALFRKRLRSRRANQAAREEA